jgi:serine/threonine protein kinase
MNHPSTDALRDLLSNEHLENAELVDHIESCGICKASIEEILNESLSPLRVDSISNENKPADKWAEKKDRFLLGEEIGRGGMGIVYSAEDLELRRQVAVKRIHPKYCQSPSIKQRFEFEAQITGHLEHPGIAPVYSVSVDSDGRLFYAMRLLNGKNFRDTVVSFYACYQPSQPTSDLPLEQQLPASECQRRKELRKSPQFRSLVRSLVQVAECLAFAHSRGFIHRDVKPSNIILGEFGATYLVDWGLAKQIHSTNADTPPQDGIQSTSVGETNAVVGSPEFMSPEQASVDSKGVSHRSDIYSLGATLFFLLTGESPTHFPTNPTSPIDQQLRHRKTRNVAARDPLCPKGLLAICIRAMAEAPKERYSSIADMAKDLEQWLADEPISCMQDSLSDKLARSIRRHRHIYSALMVSFCLLLIGSLVFAFVAMSLSNQERQARRQAERNQSALLVTLGKVTDVVRDELIYIEKTQKVREKLRVIVENGLADLKVDPAVASLSNEDEILINLRLAESLLSSQDVEDKLDKVDEYISRAVIVCQKALKSKGNNLNPRYIAQTFQVKADLEFRRGRISEAVDTVKLGISSLPFSEDADVQSPEQLGIARDWHLLTNRLGELKFKQGDPSCLADFRHSEIVAQKILALAPNDIQARQDLAIAHQNVAMALAINGMPEDALPKIEGSIELLAANNQSLDTTEWLAESIQIKAGILFSLERFEEARAALLEFLPTFRNVANTDPDSLSKQGLLIEHLTCIAQVEGRLQNYDSALDSALQAKSIAEILVKKDSTDAIRLRTLANALDQTTDVYAALGQLPDAMTNAQQAIQLTRDFAANEPTNQMFQRDMAVRLEKLANVYAAMGETERALDTQNESRNLFKAIHTATPSPASLDALHLSTILHTNLLCDSGNPKLAETMIREAILEHETTQDLNKIENLRNVAQMYDVLSTYLQKQKEFQQALDATLRSHKAYVQLCNHNSHQVNYIRTCYVMLNRAAELMTELNNFPDAEEMLIKSRLTYAELPAEAKLIPLYCLDEVYWYVIRINLNAKQAKWDQFDVDTKRALLLIHQIRSESSCTPDVSTGCQACLKDILISCVKNKRVHLLGRTLDLQQNSLRSEHLQVVNAEYELIESVSQLCMSFQSYDNDEPMISAIDSVLKTATENGDLTNFNSSVLFVAQLLCLAADDTNRSALSRRSYLLQAHRLLVLCQRNGVDLREISQIQDFETLLQMPELSFRHEESK